MTQRVTWLLTGMLLAGVSSIGCQTPQPIPHHPVNIPSLRQRAETCLKLAVQYKANPAIRVAGIEAMQSAGMADGLPWIRAGLLDDHPAVRFAACVALGRMKDDTARVALRQRVEDEDPNVRAAAIFALHMLGDRQYSSQLSYYLLEHENPLVRRNAAFLLGFTEDEGAVPLLARAMKDRDIGVQNNALEAMSRLGNAEARQQLVLMVNAGVGADEVFAISALADTHERKYADLYVFKLADLETPHLETCLAAARALGFIDRDEGYQLAVHALRYTTNNVPDDTDSVEGKILRTRQLAASALGAIGQPGALPALEDMLEYEKDARYQVVAAQAILDILQKNESALALSFPPVDENSR